MYLPDSFTDMGANIQSPVFLHFLVYDIAVHVNNIGHNEKSRKEGNKAAPTLT